MEWNSIIIEVIIIVLKRTVVVKFDKLSFMCPYFGYSTCYYASHLT